MNPAIVLYTHTDMADVWPIFFGQMKKYYPFGLKYVFVNEDSTDIPYEYQRIVYSDSLSYRQRLIHCLSSLGEKYILFQHEDMFLYDQPDYDAIERGVGLLRSSSVYSFVRFINIIRSVKKAYGFCVQPSIWDACDLYTLLVSSKGESIWELETGSATALRDLRLHGYDEKRGKKRGKYHYDSPIYPAMATGVVKGLYNTRQYGDELEPIFEEYDINPEIRGTND